MVPKTPQSKGEVIFQLLLSKREKYVYPCSYHLIIQRPSSKNPKTPNKKQEVLSVLHPNRTISILRCYVLELEGLVPSYSWPQHKCSTFDHRKSEVKGFFKFRVELVFLRNTSSVMRILTL